MTVENILTVDVEEWYHICGVEDHLPEERWPELESRVDPSTRRILDTLAQRGVKATFFVLGFVAERHPDLIRRIQEAGHEIATHGYAHQQVYTLTPHTFREDLRRAMGIITRITGRPVTGYRAPEWSIRDDSLWALYILKQEGLAYDSSMAPLPIIGNPRYATVPFRFDLDQGPLWEFPPLVIKAPFLNLPLGGGWGLRVLPYRLLRATIRKLNRQGQPALVHIHPREFDRGIPRIRLPPLKWLVLNARIERTERRLERLLNDFHFAPASAVLERMKCTGASR
jgi:polysaccharide deacetylase family protein (PEP-CTERM system associated)